MADDPPAEVIEWGGPEPERPGLIDRIAAPPGLGVPRAGAPEFDAPPDGESRPVVASTPVQAALEPWQRPSPLVFGLIGAGFAATLAALVLPWMHFRLPVNDRLEGTPTEFDYSLGEITTWQVLVYGFSVLLAFGAIGFMIAARPAHRRAACAVAFGVLAGQFAMLVGLAPTISGGAGLAGPAQLIGLAEDTATLSIGYSIGVLATLLLVGAVALCARDQVGGPAAPRARRQARQEFDDQEIEEPLELTVSSVPLGPIR